MSFLLKSKVRARTGTTRSVVASAMLLFTSACADGADQAQTDPNESDVLSSISGSATDWTQCASEWNRCSFSGTREVLYTSRTKSVVKTFTNGVDCTNTSFGGDIDVGHTKACYYRSVKSATPAPTPAPMMTVASPVPVPTPAPTSVPTPGSTPTATAPSDVALVPASTPVPAPATTSATEVPAPVSTPVVVPAPVSTPVVVPAPVSTPVVVPAPVATPSPAPTPTPTATPAATLPPQLCTAPLGLADSAHPTTVVGSGSAASCTEGALRSAVALGGVITFNCGDAVTTIKLTAPLVAPSTQDTVIDGHDNIVLDGGGSSQLLRAVGTDFRQNDHVLTVQRLTMSNGHDLGTGFKARDGQKTCAWGYKEGGGGAIYTSDVNLHVWGVNFINNRGPEIGPDVGGGAIRMVGSKNLVVVNSTFRGNSASNGGAIGVLHVSTALYNTTFDANSATGVLANFANDNGCPTFNHDGQGGAGGLGGAFYSDGFDPGDTFCGVRMSDNRSGDMGGALFRSAYWGLLSNVGKQVISWEKSSFERNKSPTAGGGAAYVNNALFTLKGVSFVGNDSGDGDGGALKLTGLTVQADDVTFTNNTAKVGGGVAHWSAGPDGAGSATNLKFAGNTPQDYVGVFPH